MQQTFNPVRYGFSWTDDGWYDWDSKAGHKAALQARNAEVKRLRAEGRRVRCFTLRNQLISLGGIGSGRPHIEEIVTVYGLNAD